MSQMLVQPAEASDAASIAACVCEAYVGYVERIGRQPGPMLDDYASVIQARQVHVADEVSNVVGVIVLKASCECLFVENVAVRPKVRGTGLGRRFFELAEAEARRQGYEFVCLATHELMVENDRSINALATSKAVGAWSMVIRGSSSASPSPQPRERPPP